MLDYERYNDALLNINTDDLHQFNQSLIYHRYEATSYYALECLFQSYELKSGCRIVDFGAGKGRFVFYVHHYFGASAAGVEMNERLYNDALTNLARYRKRNKGKNSIEFFNCLAEDYVIEPFDNKFYFFNPFSVQIFIRVIQNILLSAEQHRRKVEVILYYPTVEYIYFLEKQTPFELRMEIPIKDWSINNKNERFLIYEWEPL